MRKDPTQAIIILGGGTAGLLSVLAIKKRNPSLKIKVVRSPEIGTIEVGEGSFPHLPKFLHGYLELDPAEFYREVSPSWKLGINYEWGPRPEGFYYTFRTQFDSQFQALPKSTGFYCDEAIGYPDYATAMMKHGRAVLGDQRGTPVVDDAMAYHLENGSFVSYLESKVQKMGIEFLDDTVAEVACDDAGVSELKMDSGKSLRADLYLDCSGFRSLLLRGALQDFFESYDSSLCCDRAIAGGWEREDEPILPYTTAETINAGLSWRIEHRERVNRGYVYSSNFLSDDEAEKEFRTKNPKVEETRLIRFRSGIHQNPWTKNVVAVGNASGFVEPLESTALGQIAQDAQSIAEILVHSGCRISETMSEQHNARSRRSWGNIRNFLAIHYRFNTRLDTPFWRAARKDVDLAGADEFVRYYQENGPDVLFRPTLIDGFDQFGLDGYFAMMVGMKVPYQNRYTIPEAEKKTLQAIHSACEQKALKSYDCAKGLELVESPGWKWNMDFYKQAWNRAVSD